MLRSFAALVFIGAAASVAIFLAGRPTIADGRVMAADLLEQFKGRGITGMDCDPEIPIGSAGAVFQCKVAADDGSTARIEYTMNRAGSLAAKVLDSTGSTRTTVPASGDPWGN